MTVEQFYFNSRDELLRVNISSVAYFEADGNYTTIIMANGLRGVVGMNLTQTARLLHAGLGDRARRFVRIGRTYIINLDYVFSINVLRQRLILSDFRRFTYTLEISREALRALKDLYVRQNREAQVQPAPPDAPDGQ